MAIDLYFLKNLKFLNNIFFIAQVLILIIKRALLMGNQQVQEAASKVIAAVQRNDLDHLRHFLDDRSFDANVNENLIPTAEILNYKCGLTGTLPLCEAVKINNGPIIRLLVERGARPDERSGVFPNGMPYI